MVKLLPKEKAKSLFEKNLKVTKQKLRDSVTTDNFIIQTVGSLDELQKIVNMMSKRLREWYGLHNPEYAHQDIEHKEFAENIVSKNRDELLTQIGAKDTIGADIDKKDLDAMYLLAKEVLSVFELIEQEEAYLDKTMKDYAPNLTAVATFMIGARLLAHTGSLKNLMEMPASTIQIIGAEKALFRHMRSGAKCPKYGHLLYHPVVNSVNRDMKGKAARAVADKISFAAKLDYFKGEFLGEKYRKELEEKFS